MSWWERRRRSLARTMGVDLTHTQEHYARILQSYVQPACRWLEVGCGHQILPEWAMPIPRQQELVERAKMLIGLDVDDALYRHPLLTHRVIGLGNSMPFQSSSFDLVSANMVVEHVHRPEEFLSEVERILHPGGHFVFHTSNFRNVMNFMAHFVPENIKNAIVWRLEQRRPEDIFPTRYEMNTVTAIKKLVAQTSFRIERLSINGSVGVFGTMGPLGWAEVFLIKAASLQRGHYNSNLICVLRREAF